MRQQLFVSRALFCVALVVACSGGGATPSPTGLSLGSNYSDEVPKAALQQVINGFSASSDMDEAVKKAVALATGGKAA